MSEDTKRRFNLHLPGLLEVLAGSLYSSSKVGLRELIQNAHDSCIRRRVEGHETNYHPRINITVNKAANTLAISDNGHGLSVEEIDTYLSTIGRSYTGELKGELSIFSNDEATNLIGQFGFGFLSAFLLADEVTLVTKSLQPGSEAIKWQSGGGEFYQLTSGTRDYVGTTITLKIKPGIAFIFDNRILADTIRKFADFLPIPIRINDSPTPVNLMQPPWQAENTTEASLQYIRRTFRMQGDPLCVIHLNNQLLDLGHDTFEVPLKGILFVPASSVVSVHEYGDLMIFIRRMFICDDQKNLLPPWARFVRGVIDCPYLQPTASRESIQEDDAFYAVQQALESQLGAALKQIATEDPHTWRQIVQGHTDLITGWAVRDSEFFNLVADLVLFRTSRGYLTLPEYLKLTGASFYYVTRHLGSVQEQLLAEGYGAPVIDAHWFAVKPFLEKYASWHEGIDLIRMDGEVEQLMQPVPEPSFVKLLDFYRGQGIRVQVVAFKPREVPALMVYHGDAEFILDARQAIDQGELAAPFADLIGGYLDQKSSTEALKGTLYLNADCDLIRTLVQETYPAITFEATLTLVYQIARLFSGRTLTAQGATSAFEKTIQSLEVLLTK